MVQPVRASLRADSRRSCNHGQPRAQSASTEKRRRHARCDCLSWPLSRGRTPVLALMLCKPTVHNSPVRGRVAPDSRNAPSHAAWPACPVTPLSGAEGPVLLAQRIRDRASAPPPMGISWESVRATVVRGASEDPCRDRSLHSTSRSGGGCAVSFIARRRRTTRPMHHWLATVRWTPSMPPLAQLSHDPQDTEGPRPYRRSVARARP